MLTLACVWAAAVVMQAVLPRGPRRRDADQGAPPPGWPGDDDARWDTPLGSDRDSVAADAPSASPPRPVNIDDLATVVRDKIQGSVEATQQKGREDIRNLLVQMVGFFRSEIAKLDERQESLHHQLLEAQAETVRQVRAAVAETGKPPDQSWLATVLADEIHGASERVAREIGGIRDQVHRSAIEMADNDRRLGQEIADLRAAGSGDLERLAAQLTEAQTAVAGHLLDPFRAEREATVAEVQQVAAAMREEVAGIREHVIEALHSWLRELVVRQEQLEQRLSEQQAELVAGAAARLDADRVATAGDVRAEVEKIREEAVAPVHVWIDELVARQEQLEQLMIELQPQVVAGVTAHLQQLEQRLTQHQAERASKAAGLLKADRAATSSQFRAEIDTIRSDVVATTQSAIGELAASYHELEARLIEIHPRLVSDVVEPLKAERNAILGRIRNEHNNLRDQLSGLVRQEVAQLADEQQRLVGALAETLGTQVTGQLQEEIAKVAEDERRFRTRLATAASVIESRFAEFSERVTASIEQLADPDRLAEAVSASVTPRTTQDFNRTMKRLWNESAEVFARTRADTDQRVQEIAAVLERVVDQQQRVDATLAAVEKEVARVGRQKMSGRIELDDDQISALRSALRAGAAKHPPSAPTTKAPRAAKPKAAPGATPAPKRTRRSS